MDGKTLIAAVLEMNLCWQLICIQHYVDRRLVGVCTKIKFTIQLTYAQFGNIHFSISLKTY